MNSLAHELINSLAELDTRLKGLGLYSCSEYGISTGHPHAYGKIEWEQALQPRLKQLGYRIDIPFAKERVRYRDAVKSTYSSVLLRTPTARTCDLRLIRTSKVKVRRYGSGYHVDRTVDFESRWAQLKMEKHIRELWWPGHYCANADSHMVLFVGFDKANRPFHQEMTALERAVRWTDHHVIHESKSWPDPYGRDFNVLVACWTSTGET